MRNIRCAVLIAGVNLSQDKPNIKVDYCTHEAALYSVKHWHYSKSLPAGKIYKLGVWENENFIGCVLYSRGANNNLLKPYGLNVTEGCELTRIALDTHITPVTQIVSITLKMLKRDNPGLRLIISFADDRQGHLGKIYQAGNWVYTGYVKSTPEHFINGKWVHQRTAFSLLGTVKTSEIRRDWGGRFRYLMPLDKQMKRKIESLRQPYPKSMPNE